jgi:hypothetical protein
MEEHNRLLWSILENPVEEGGSDRGRSLQLPMGNRLFIGVKLNKGKEGATNYLHDLQSGHISNYLIHLGQIPMSTCNKVGRL